MELLYHKFLLWMLPVFLLSCSDDKKEPDDGGGGESYTSYNFTGTKEIFGFYGQNRYSYCPSIVKEDDGSVHMFFCGNPNQGIMVDNIYHIKINADGSKTSAKSVLQPGPSGSWDDHHTCDPSVIKGEFQMDGQTYQYAMFFLTNKYGVYYNEIGIAFSNQLDADAWVKYPDLVVKKTWGSDGDQNLPNGGKSWGVGQPSAVSLDRGGKVLLTYTIGDISGTRIAWVQVNLSNMDTYSPAVATTVIASGLKNLDNTGNDYTCNADFAICPDEDIIVMVRPVQPHPSDYPAYLNKSLEVDQMKLSNFLNSTGTWTPIVRITPDVTKYPRNHNAGIERNAYGEIENWEEPTIYYTISKAAPDVNASTGQHAEWTYHIWKGSVKKSVYP